MNPAPVPLRPPPPANNLTRRDFFWLTLGWLAAAVTLVATGLATIRSLIPNVLFEPSRRFKAGRPEDYPDGTVTFLDDVRLLIVREGNSFRAASAICPHLGCTVNVVTGEHPFLCPCHGSHFDKNGAVVNGPSPRGLTWHLVSLSKDGRLVVDLDRSVDAGTPLII